MSFINQTPCYVSGMNCQGFPPFLPSTGTLFPKLNISKTMYTIQKSSLPGSLLGTIVLQSL